MRTSIPVNNFISGQIDRDLKGRFDLPLQQNGLELMKNFYSTLKGTVKYRTGFRFVDEIGYAAMYEFKFNEAQCYLLIMNITHIEFWSYLEDGTFVQVLDGSNNPLKVTHPWGTEIFNLDYAQNGDVMYFTHNKGSYPEHKLTRTAANAFNLAAATYTGGNLGNPATSGKHGYPRTIKFYESRLQRGGATNKPTFLYGSKGGSSYDDITIGTGTNDGYQFDLAEAISPILWLESGQNSLLAGTQEGVLTINGGNVDTAITPTNITAKLPCRDGVSAVRPISKDEFVLYVSQNQRAIYAFQYDVLYELFKAANLTKASRDLTKGKITKLAYRDGDTDNYVYAKCGQNLLGILFSNDENANAWGLIDTKGEFVDICSVTRPDGNKDFFANIKRSVNGVDRYYLEKLTDYADFSRFEDFITDVDIEDTDLNKLTQKQEDIYAYYRKIADELRNCCHLDSSIVYDGLETTTLTFDDSAETLTSSAAIFQSGDVGRRIQFRSITGREYGLFEILEVTSSTVVKVEVIESPSITTCSQWYLSATEFEGLDHLEGETVSVVGNGGYIGDFVVSGGKINISTANVNKVGTAIIGLKYKGFLKSCNLGLMLQGSQTLTTPKNLYKMVLRLIFSAGGKFGDDMYDLQEIQKFNPDGLYNIPPLPMDKDVEISYSGSYDNEKHYYIVQDSPLPFAVAMAIPYYNQITNT